MIYHFCTYFDQHYLDRGLALYQSLREHCPGFRLWALCMDNIAYRILEELNFPELRAIALEEFERNDAKLKQAKTNRSKIEYYFTCTPSLPLFILNKWSDVDIITYLDADLFFFGSPASLFKEMNDASIAIIEHRFSPHLKDRERFGLYNVGWLSFRRDTIGLACLHWWRARCLEWCYHRYDDERFADQKYLDDWPTRFQGVRIIDHKGANLAPWNIGNYKLSLANEKVVVDKHPVIFFHFHGTKEIIPCVYTLGLRGYGAKSTRLLRNKVYRPYIKCLHEARALMQEGVALNQDKSIREVKKKQAYATLRKLYSIAKIPFGLIQGDLIIASCYNERPTNTDVEP